VNSCIIRIDRDSAQLGGLADLQTPEFTP
jgi:hypothetical protein